MNAPAAKPVVLVPACNRQLGHHPFHIAGKKYVDFVRLAGCLPLVVPNADAGDFVPQVLARGVPLFAICRGTQETNVALGGSLHQAVQEVPGYADHRAPAEASAEVQYGLVHEVEVQPGGVLARIVDRPRFQVNSVHGQGVKRLAQDLHVEARAPDGLIEAFSYPKASGFNLCVQWHPEWQAADNPVSVQLATAFGAACREYRKRYRDPAS